MFVQSMKSLWIVRQDLSCYVFSFVHAISTEVCVCVCVCVWRHFSLLVEQVFFCSIAWLIFGHTWLTSPSKMTSLWNWLLFILIERDKIKRVCVTLNEGYLTAANRGSKIYTYFKSKYNISAFNEKTNFFVCRFYYFLRLQMYEAIAAIFWQSARKTMYFLGEVDLMFGFDWYLSGPTDRWGISTCSRIYHLKLSYIKF